MLFSMLVGGRRLLASRWASFIYLSLMMAGPFIVFIVFLCSVWVSFVSHVFLVIVIESICIIEILVWWVPIWASEANANIRMSVRVVGLSVLNPAALLLAAGCVCVGIGLSGGSAGFISMCG